ncbi:hypothetical protein MTO96_039144 [Rhipicephalus appendiculatus]
MSNCRHGYEAAEPMIDFPKLQSLGNATQAKTSKEEQRQEMLATEDETVVEVLVESEEFPRAEIGGDFTDDDSED